MLLTFPGVAFVTGAGGSGIGAAVCRELAKSECFRFAIADINKETLEITREAILQISPEAQVLAMAGDVSDESFVNSLADEVQKTYNRVDYSINCAGVLGGGQRSADMSVDEFDRITRINVRGTWLTSRAMIRIMLKQEPLEQQPGHKGAVVNIASQLGLMACPTAGAYCASKAAIVNMTRADAIDYSAEGIRVNCVCPGLIRTPMITGSPELEERIQPAVMKAPMKRMGTAEEVANTILFLCSEQASFVQGHAFTVDGGYAIL